MPFTALEIANHLHGEVLGDNSVVLSGFAPAETAKAGELTFAENETYFQRAEASAASAILVDGNFKSTKLLIKVRNARIAFAKALTLFYPPPVFEPGIHPSAVIAPSASINSSCHIGPHVVIGERVRMGAKCVIEAGTFIAPECQLGEEVHLYPRVTLYAKSQIGNRVIIHSGTVIGSDGFGYVFDQGAHRKVPQVGNVVIYDDVEIGANTAIDRGALGSTVIGRGTKIDNLVHIAHNVSVGQHCVITAQVGFAGSTKVGNYAAFGGQAGVAGHLKLGNQVTVGGQSGVMHNIPDGEKWLGSPAMPDRQMKRIFVALQRLPELVHKVNELETRLQELERPKA